jgi:hypothetical protein
MSGDRGKVQNNMINSVQFNLNIYTDAGLSRSRSD